MFFDKSGNQLPLKRKDGSSLTVYRYGEGPDIEPSMVDPDTPSGVQPTGQSSGFELVLSEEFNHPVQLVDAETGHVKFRDTGMPWATYYPDWSRFTSQVPGGNHTNTNQDAYYDTSKVSVSGGAMHLACDEEETVAGLPYTAGMVTTKDMFEPTSGWFESRLRMTGTRNSRHWPAFWLVDADFNNWEREIDIYEVFGTINEYLTNVYYENDPTDIHANSFSDFDDYHVYGVHWDNTAVTFYRDGVETYSTNTVTGPMYMILNNGAEHIATGTMPVIDVDYVRAWSAS